MRNARSQNSECDAAYEKYSIIFKIFTSQLLCKRALMEETRTGPTYDFADPDKNPAHPGELLCSNAKTGCVTNRRNVDTRPEGGFKTWKTFMKIYR